MESGKLYSVAVSPDGAILAAAGQSGVIRLSDLHGGKLARP